MGTVQLTQLVPFSHIYAVPTGSDVTVSRWNVDFYFTVQSSFTFYLHTVANKYQIVWFILRFFLGSPNVILTTVGCWFKSWICNSNFHFHTTLIICSGSYFFEIDTLYLLLSYINLNISAKHISVLNTQ